MRMIKVVAAATATALACYYISTNKHRLLVDLRGPRELLTNIVESNKAYAKTRTSFNNFIEKEQDRDFMDAICKYGIPGTENVLFRDTYVMSYSYRLKQPNWTMELLTKGNIATSTMDVDRTKCIFSLDPDIPPMFTARNEDYKNSGYQRGHLVAAGNHRNNQDHLCMTFLMSNVSPQVGMGFNSGIWSDLENYTRNLAQSYESLYIVTGPLFLPTQNEFGQLFINYEVIGSNQVAVPTHYFKIILGVTKDNEYEIQGFVIPNKKLSSSEHYSTYIRPIANIEKASGLVFFDQIDRDKLIQIEPENKKRNKRKAIRRRSADKKKNDESASKKNDEPTKKRMPSGNPIPASA